MMATMMMRMMVNAVVVCIPLVLFRCLSMLGWFNLMLKIYQKDFSHQTHCILSVIVS